MSPGTGRWRHAGPPDHPRLFVAVPLPGAVVDAVRAVVDAVRSEPLPPGMRDVRWVRMEGLHLTLVFLGPTDPARVPGVIDAVRRAAAAGSAGAGVLAGTGTFPQGGRPRTIWIGVPEGQAVLADLAHGLQPALEAAGKAIDVRPFRAHLTVARCDGLVAGPLVARRLAAAVGDARIPVVFDRLALFESVTGDGPARYRNVVDVPLSGPRDDAPVYHPGGSTTPADRTPGDPGSS